MGVSNRAACNQLAYDSPQCVRNICISQVIKAPQQSIQDSNTHAGCSGPDEKLHTLPAVDAMAQLQLACSHNTARVSCSQHRRLHLNCSRPAQFLQRGRSPVLQLHDCCRCCQKLRSHQLGTRQSAARALEARAQRATKSAFHQRSKWALALKQAYATRYCFRES